jgi:phosphate starvation-inducible membrane PsiE
MIVSVLTLEASFLVISIASDLRYHLWSMTASALVLILLSDRFRSSRVFAVSAAILALVVAGGVVARRTLPPAPDSYEAMVRAPSG